jgi:hypothetical protein
MRHRRVVIVFLIVAALSVGFGISTSLADDPPDMEQAAALLAPNYAINWSVVAGGGNAMSSPSFVLLGTSGQPAISGDLTSAGFRLSAGYWSGATPWMRNFLPKLWR